MCNRVLVRTIVSDTADVVVIGAGPSGMAAAVTLAEHGIEVQVFDEQASPGGQVYRAVEKVTAQRPADLPTLGEQYARGLRDVERFRRCGIEYVPHAAVWELDASDSEHVRLGVLRDDRAATIRTRHVLIATGAIERPTPFPGWTLPGVMSTGAAQTLLKESGLVAQGRVILAGSGPLLYLFAWQMLRANHAPFCILDTTGRMSFKALGALAPAAFHAFPELSRGLRWLAQIRRSSVDRIGRVTALQAIGDDQLQSVRYRRNDRWHDMDADMLLVHDGVMPNTWLAMSAGCEHYWHAQQQCWHPYLRESGVTSHARISIVGDAGGIVGGDLAATRARLAALHLAHGLGVATISELHEAQNAARPEIKRQNALRAFLDRYYAPAATFQVPQDDETIVCRCEEVTVAQIKAVAALGCTGPNQGKAFTRCGMGPCMGRECGITVGGLLNEYHDLGMQHTGYYRIRPPVKPITVGQLADLDVI